MATGSLELAPRGGWPGEQGDASPLGPPEQALLARLVSAQELDARGPRRWIVRYGDAYYVAPDPIGRALAAFLAAAPNLAAAEAAYREAVPQAAGMPSFSEALRLFLAQVQASPPSGRRRREGYWLFRWPLLPARWADALASRFAWLFRPLPCTVGLLLASAGLFLLLASDPRAAALPGASPVLVFGLLLAIVLWHEVGHCAGAWMGGVRSGGIGVGVYLVFPVFFADVRHSWCVPRRSRLLVDGGGLYFQYLATGLLAGASALSHWPPGRQAVLASAFLMLHTLNPCIKMDGYWLLSDLLGYYNLHERAFGARPAAEVVPRRFLTAYRLAVIAFFLLLAGASLRVLPAHLQQVAELWTSPSRDGWEGIVEAAQRGLSTLVLLLPGLVLLASLGPLTRLFRLLRRP